MSAPGATWKVVRWNNRPADIETSIPMLCECGQDANVPCGVLVGGSLIAITGDNYMVFDPPGFEPPDNWLPDELQCRKCGCRLVAKIEPEAKPEDEIVIALCPVKGADAQ